MTMVLVTDTRISSMKRHLGLGVSPMKDKADKSLLGNKRNLLDSDDDNRTM